MSEEGNKELFVIEQDSDICVADFVMECCEIDESLNIPRAQLMHEYNKFRLETARVARISPQQLYSGIIRITNVKERTIGSIQHFVGIGINEKIRSITTKERIAGINDLLEKAMCVIEVSAVELSSVNEVIKRLSKNKKCIVPKEGVIEMSDEKIYHVYETDVGCCKREQFEVFPAIRLVKGDIISSSNGVEMEVLRVVYSSGRALKVHLGVPKHLGVSEKEFSEMVKEKRRNRK